MILEKHQKIALFDGPGKLSIVQIQLPAIVPGSILVRVESCAICGSDLRIFREGNPRIQPPRVLGHEIAGEIVEIGKGVTDFKRGDLVAIGADVPCGECIHCTSGRGNCCDINYAIGYQFDGGFAQYILLDPLVVKYGPIAKFNSNISFDEAALSEPLACCINGYERGILGQSRKCIVIFGAGPIGLMLAMLAPIYHFEKVIVIEPSETRLSYAKKIISVNFAINPKKEMVQDVVMELTEGVGADLVFTANPIVETHEQAIDILAKRGVVNFFGGLPKVSRPIQFLSNSIHYKEAYITGSHGSIPQQLKKALQLIEKGSIIVEPLISHKFTLDKLEEGITKAGDGLAMKVIINPNA